MLRELDWQLPAQTSEATERDGTIDLGLSVATCVRWPLVAIDSVRSGGSGCCVSDSVCLFVTIACRAIPNE
jgi:hypothetical protein